jgi:hypothetical protein
MKMKNEISNSNNIMVISSFTIDKYNGRFRPGGPAIYSTLGVIRTNTSPLLIAGIGEDFKYRIKFMDNLEKKLIQGKKTFLFEIETLVNGKRKVRVIERGPSICSIEIENGNAIINPVCQEISPLLIRKINGFIAVDIQGFSRVCEEGKEVSLRMPEFPPTEKYLVLHGNSDEIYSIYDSLNHIFKIGFREIILSFGKDGFEIITRDGTSFQYKPKIIGENEVGNGDFLLGSYFTLRMGQNSVVDSAKIAGMLSDYFSKENITELYLQ